MIGGRSWPSISSPHSSLVVKSIGPTIRSRPRSRSQSAAAPSSAAPCSGSVLALEEAEHPPVVVLELVEAVVDVGA